MINRDVLDRCRAYQDGSGLINPNFSIHECDGGTMRVIMSCEDHSGDMIEQAVEFTGEPDSVGDGIFEAVMICTETLSASLSTIH